MSYKSKTILPEFGALITAWYLKNKRNLPWRDTQNPYIIWISEIILQQTRVDQGMAYFHKFVNAYPRITDLADASEDEVLKMWQGLGYYSRARNLHATAKNVSQHYKGIFPEDYSSILQLKGIGEYTSAAIASFAFNKPHAVVDGNVYRLLSRYFGIETPIDSTPGKKQFKELADQLLDRKSPGIYNQAIMEFGALQCKPANPKCTECPIAPGCYAFAHNKISSLPVKAKKLKTADRYFNYLHISNKNHLVLNKRQGNDIWKGLYDFPLIETSLPLEITQLMKLPEWEILFGKHSLVVRSVSKEYIHKLSHQTIHAVFIAIDFSKIKTVTSESFLLASRQELHKYAIPRLMDIYLQAEKNK